MERYEAYKDSGVEWIGEIPEHWSCANLGAITKLRKCLNRDGSINKVLSLSYGSIKERIIDNTGLLPESFTTYNVIQPGDVVLRLTDLQNDQRSLRVGICRERGIITAAYTTVIPETIDAGYLFYSLADFDYWKGFYGLAGGVRQSLTFDGIRNLKFPLPSMFEQRAIADYLDAKTAEVDALVADCEREVELLREYRKAVISEAVTKGLDPDAPMKDSGVEWIGAIPEGWGIAPLKTLFSFGKGLPITKADLIEEGAPVISYGQIHSKTNTPAHIKQELVRYVSPDFLESNAASITYEGDFLFADTSEDIEGTGNFVFHDCSEQIFAGYHTLILRPVDTSSGRYLSYLFQDDQWRGQLRSRVSGVKLFSLTLRVLDKATLLLPTEPEQLAIADYLDAKTAEIDSIIEAKQSMADKLREYRKSLISEAVTGKFKVEVIQ